MTRSALAILALFFIGLTAGDLHAGETSPETAASAGGGAVAPAQTLHIAGTPVFGTDAPAGDGWVEVIARIDNTGTTLAKGTVELASSYGAMTHGSDKIFSAKAPFSVPAGKTAVVRIPTHGLAVYVPQVSLTVWGEDGKKVTDANLSISGTSGPLLVDVSQPSRLSIVMRGWPMSLPWNPHTGGYGGPYSSGGSMNLAVGAPSYDPTTGDPVLPDHAAGYSAVSALLIQSDALAKLEGAALEAIVNWVLSGGTLALVPSRPEDLRLGVLPSLVGGTVTKTSAPSALLGLPALERPSSGGYNPLGEPPPIAPPAEQEEAADAGAPATPIGYFIPARSVARPVGRRIGPLPAVRELLTGYQGGNLRPSAFGASATYGLGEVHLLAFDPTKQPAIDDGWVHARVVDLVERGWDLRSRTAFPHGSGDRRARSLSEIRKALDPNENFRPALGISAILLVLYSIAAGPLTFIRATKKGRPLDPLVWAPLWSAGAFGLIVLVGLAGKGWRGRARHVSLVESGAGMSRAPIRRFRGFFSSQTRALAIRATDRTCVLDVANTEGAKPQHGDAVLRLDRNGASLENLTALPWQTVVVAEEGMMELAEGISVIPTADGSVDVINRSGKALKDVLVHVPLQDIRYFASLKAGDRVHANTGRIVMTAAARPTVYAGSKRVHDLDAAHIGAIIGGKSGDEMTQSWTALANAAGPSVDWWPDGAAVVLGEIEGGEGRTSDSGLSVESDHLYFRVIGQGGVP